MIVKLWWRTAGKKMCGYDGGSCYCDLIVHCLLDLSLLGLAIRSLDQSELFMLWQYDMKSDVVMMAIVLIWDFISMFLGLDMVLYIVGYLYILYITLFRLIVLYSWCRVNRDTNISVVCVLCNNFLLPLRVWAPCVAFPTCGVHPHWAAVRSIPFDFGAQRLSFTPVNPPGLRLV